MIASADKIVLLADHSKFGREALSSFARLEDIDVVVTDEQTEPQYIELLKSRGIEVIIAHN
jgi:DeoR family transcriptional regulator, fructose operon transcriptional repressor